MEGRQSVAQFVCHLNAKQIEGKVEPRRRRYFFVELDLFAQHRFHVRVKVVNFVFLKQIDLGENDVIQDLIALDRAVVVGCRCWAALLNAPNEFVRALNHKRNSRRTSKKKTTDSMDLEDRRKTRQNADVFLKMLVEVTNSVTRLKTIFDDLLIDRSSVYLRLVKLSDGVVRAADLRDGIG